MSYHNGPRIVTNGLVLYLDAGNSKSYPGSGTIWADLSGNNRNGTLTNGPTYSAINKGSISFDGSNDYIGAFSGSSPFNVGNMSYEIVFMPKNNPYRGPLGGSDVLNTIPYFYLDYHNGYIYTYHNVAPGYIAICPVSLNSICHFVCTRNNLSEINYLNGSTTTPRTLANNSGFNNGFGWLGGLQPLGWYWQCNIYMIRIYNRALSANEVSQNYNALKGRYNL